MKHLIKFQSYNESVDNDENQLTIIQSIGFLKNPKNQIIGCPMGIEPGTSKTSIHVGLLKDFLKGRELTDSELKQVEPILIFIEDLQERSQRDKPIMKWLEKYQIDGEKESGVMAKVRGFYKGAKRDKNPLFGR